MKYSRNDHLPELNVNTVRMALIVGARDPHSLADLFGIDGDDLRVITELSDLISVLISNREARWGGGAGLSVKVRGDLIPNFKDLPAFPALPDPWEE